MSGLKALKNRIASVRATQKITRAMQMVAASKLRRAQTNLLAARPYIGAMETAIEQIVANLPEGAVDVPLYAGTGRSDRLLLVVLSAQRGLCGSFNTNIARRSRVTANEQLSAGNSVKLLCGGRKAAEQLKAMRRFEIVDTVHLSMRADLTAIALDIAKDISARFSAGEFDVCKVVYAEYVNVLTQKVKVKTLIPWVEQSAGAASVVDGDAATASHIPDANSGIPVLEPEAGELLAAALERNLVSQITRGLLENAASEQGARMTAMGAATRNAGEMIDKLTLTFNRSRQAIITKELIEIISGAEAV